MVARRFSFKEWKRDCVRYWNGKVIPATPAVSPPGNRKTFKRAMDNNSQYWEVTVCDSLTIHKQEQSPLRRVSENRLGTESTAFRLRHTAPLRGRFAVQLITPWTSQTAFVHAIKWSSIFLPAPSEIAFCATLTPSVSLLTLSQANSAAAVLATTMDAGTGNVPSKTERMTAPLSAAELTCKSATRHSGRPKESAVQEWRQSLPCVISKASVVPQRDTSSSSSFPHTTIDFRPPNAANAEASSSARANELAPSN